MPVPNTLPGAAGAAMVVPLAPPHNSCKLGGMPGKLTAPAAALKSRPGNPESVHTDWDIDESVGLNKLELLSTLRRLLWEANGGEMGR